MRRLILLIAIVFFAGGCINMHYVKGGKGVNFEDSRPIIRGQGEPKPPPPSKRVRRESTADSESLQEILNRERLLRQSPQFR